MQAARIGVYGLGTMGRALALNMAEQGISVAICNRETDWIDDTVAAAGPLAAQLIPAPELIDLVAAVPRPRNLLFMIPSGAPMDEMIEKIAPLLEEGDTIIDGGNADFHATRRRGAALQARGLHFVGMGVSGGETGARHGPSMMVGGSDHSWAGLEPLLNAIAARYNGAPCVAHVGPDGAGHFVKTVHNGIEYADMQMIAELYGLLRDGAGWGATRIGDLFQDWSDGPLASFLVETTAEVLLACDPANGLPMVDAILDKAGQKGTGRWTVIEALKLGQSASTIEAAVGARAWSADLDTRKRAAGLLAAAAPGSELPAPQVLAEAMMAGRILSHAQGFAVLTAASDAFDWQMDLARIAEIWRAGCIIRSDLLDDLASALRAAPQPGLLVLAPDLCARLSGTIPALRQVVATATLAGLPVPALAASLAWYDSIRQARGSANLIQAQRDCFGAHGFERTDRPGTYHHDWSATDAQNRETDA